MKLVAPIALSLALFPAAAAAAPCDHQAPAREVCVERDIFLMPGVQAVFFAPSGAAAPFFGGGAQIAPIHWSHNNDRFGPSQGALFLQASILEPPESASSLAIYDLGFSLSLEKNASRRFLVPFFGATVGGTIH